MSTTTPDQPLVGVVMGSDSDWPVMEAAALALEDFGIPYEADVVSAHRMPTFCAAPWARRSAPKWTSSASASSPARLSAA